MIDHYDNPSDEEPEESEIPLVCDSTLSHD